MDRFNNAMYEHFQKLFGYLPIGTIINNKILVVHGGLFPHQNITLNDLKKYLLSNFIPSTYKKMTFNTKQIQ